MDAKETGVFTMDVVHTILAATSIEEAKKIAKEAIASYSQKIRKENIVKANSMVDKANTPKKIAFGMSNFILSFQGEKVIK